MASTWSSLGIRLMTTGENDNTWGDQTNDNLKRFENATKGVVDVAVSGDTTLTFTWSKNSSSTWSTVEHDQGTQANMDIMFAIQYITN